ncbi:MAG TPA: aldo/keto reductase [Steroidobacter sp.]
MIPPRDPLYLRSGETTVVGKDSRFPPLGFGAAAIGNLYSPVEEEEAEAAVHEALASDIRLFDTAPLYGYGLSEERLGRALRGVPRESFSISTKVGRVLRHAERVAARDSLFAVDRALEAAFDYSRDGVLRSFEGSLQRLGVDRVDVLLLHDVGRLTHGAAHEDVLRTALDEALPTMHELKRSGSCRVVGLGVNEEAVCMEVLENADIDCILLAGRYTLLEHECLDGLLREATRRSVAVLAAAPFNSGLLGDPHQAGRTYNYRSVDPETLARAERLYAAATAESVDLGAAALQFPFAHPAVVSVVAGLRSVAEVRLAAVRMRATIPPTLWRRLRIEGLISPSAPTP